MTQRESLAAESWTTEQVVALCRLIEAICPAFGCHVALTGGLLYKDGERKDADLVFYRIRQQETINVDGLFKALSIVGVERKTERSQFVIKARYGSRKIDCLFPEFEDGEYKRDDDETALRAAAESEGV